MGDDQNAGWIGAVGIDQDVPGLARHHHDARRCGEQPHHDRALRLTRLVQHRMQGGDKRNAQRCDQAQQVVARFAAEDAELVLQRYHVKAGCVDVLRRLQIGTGLVLRDCEVHRLVMGARSIRIVHGNDRCLGHIVLSAQRQFEIGGECGDAAAPGQRIADEHDAQRRSLVVMPDQAVGQLSGCVMQSDERDGLIGHGGGILPGRVRCQVAACRSRVCPRKLR